MLRFLLLFSGLITTLSLASSLGAAELSNATPSKSDFRILDLLPNLITPLAVDPGVPTDFVALTPSGNLDPYDWIYWGPKNVLEAYFKDPTSLKEPLIRVKLSGNVAQTGLNSFNNENPRELAALKRMSPKDFASIRTQWGNYPVFAIRTKMNGKVLFTAWTGLNAPEGWTLMFNLVYPEKKGHPTKKDRQLWENFLTKSTQLKDGDYFKALGQDLQEGYTVADIFGAKVKVTAEKRKSDDVMQVVVTLQSPHIEFHYLDMLDGRMGAEWKYGEPLVKVYADVVVSNGNNQTIGNYVTSVFYTDVEEFSTRAEDEKNSLVFQKAMR